MVRVRSITAGCALSLFAASGTPATAAGCFCVMNVDLGAFFVGCQDVSRSTELTPRAAKCINPRNGEEYGEEIRVKDVWVKVEAGKGQCEPCAYVAPEAGLDYVKDLIIRGGSSSELDRIRAMLDQAQ